MDSSGMTQDSKQANRIDVPDTCKNEADSPPLISINSRKTAYKVQIEEIEDEYWENEACMPKARVYVLEAEEEDVAEAEGDDEPEFRAENKDALNDAPEIIAGPPKELDPILLKPKWMPKSGDSAIGVSILAVKGWIEEVRGEPLDLCMDSCADITLVSEEYYNSLPRRPPIREGHWMSLAQLTDKDTIIKGYTKLKVFMLTTDDKLIAAKAEAYIVKGMSVPILLGEDFQLNYELGVTRNVETGTKIIFCNTPYEVKAVGVGSFEGRSEVHAISTKLNVHAERSAKAKAHRRAKARR
jgi:hypothetical protein